MTFPLKVEIYFQAICPMQNTDSFAYQLENTMVTIKTESTLVVITFLTCCLLSGMHVFQIGGECMTAIIGALTGLSFVNEHIPISFHGSFCLWIFLSHSPLSAIWQVITKS